MPTQMNRIELLVLRGKIGLTKLSDLQGKRVNEPDL